MFMIAGAGWTQKHRGERASGGLSWESSRSHHGFRDCVEAPVRGFAARCAVAPPPHGRQLNHPGAMPAEWGRSPGFQSTLAGRSQPFRTSGGTAANEVFHTISEGAV